MALAWRTSRPALLLLSAAFALGACSRAGTQLTGPASAGGTVPLSGPWAGPEGERGLAEEAPPTQAEPDPSAGPVNVPAPPSAPTTPVEPSQLVVRSVAETLTVGAGQGKAVVVRARVTWTPVKGVQRYRVFQQGVREGSAPEARQLLYTLPKWVPVAIAGGGFGLLNLKVGQEYVHTIEGLDAAGQVVCRGQDHCVPLPPLDVPSLVSPGSEEQRVGQSPTFRWGEVRGADGYYVEAFGLVANKVPALPLWRGFRKDMASINLTYGEQVDVFEGTRPMQWALPLSTGTRYAWTVCAIRTDTHAMHSAKAIARSTASLAYFTP